MESKNLIVVLMLMIASTFATRVKSGLEVLIESNYTQLHGRKPLILTNPTGITPNLDLGIDVIYKSGFVDLVGVLGPESGFRGTAQAGESEQTFVDPETGLTVYDAYDASYSTLRKFIKESRADTVIYDIQDVGSRFYTYIWAMHDCMVAASLANASFVVLDRPNPITGLNAFGPVLNRSVASYVGRQPIAQAHGMTAGELARMFVGEEWIKRESNGSDVSLEVITMQGWQRWMTWRDTCLPWVLPSPNMPTPDTAMIYPGACMFEGTSISEGRGTTRPFELLGAPFGNDSWYEDMRTLDIPNTNYRFNCFEPVFDKFANETCCGLQTYWFLNCIEDYQQFDAVYVGVALLSTAKRLYGNPHRNTGNFTWVEADGVYDVDLLAGGPLIRESIDAGLSPAEIRASWQGDLDTFKSIRKKYLLY